MSSGELFAWQAGVDWGRAGLRRSHYASASRATLVGLLEPPAVDALDQLGRDVFGYWFITGLEDYQASLTP